MGSNAVRCLVRALTLPSVVFASGLVGHIAGGGSIPTGSVLVALFVLTAVAVAPLATAPLRPAATVALLIGGQGLLHAGLELLSSAAVPAPTVMCGPSMGAMAAAPTTSCHVMMHGAAASPGPAMRVLSGGHLVMVLGHIAAAIVVGLWLAAGERVLWMLLGLGMRPVVDAWRTVAALAGGGLDEMADSRPRLLPDWGRLGAAGDMVWAVGVVSRRGPPSGCAA
jgi:hypothetical protein